MDKCKEFEMLDTQLKAYCGHGTGSLFFRHTLAPEWWSKEMAGDSSLTFSMAYVVAQRLGVPLMPLVEGGDVTPDEMTPCMAYKKRSKDNESALDRTGAFLFQLAKTTLCGIDKQDDMPCTPEKMRDKLLDGYRKVDFQSLLDYCWSLGIPVLSISKHIPNSGSHWHRPQAAVFKHDGKYCIFILEKSQFNAKPLFLLAHELGHIVAGHLNGDGCHLDDKVEFGEAEDHEGEANAFALKLLSGDYCFEPCRQSYSKGIADWAIATGREHNVNPGHLILRDVFAKSQGRDKATKKRTNAIGTAALKLINQTDDTDPQRLVLIKEYENLQEDNYKDEAYEYITRGTGLILDETGD